PLEGLSVQSCTDWQQGLDLPALQAVVVATPAATHEPIIRAALERGLHVLCEKPLTLETAACTALCQLAQARHCQLVVDHTYLFHPAVQRGRLALADLGALRYGYATRTNLGPIRNDVDALWDLAIHDVAILSYWLNQRVVRVKATGTVWLQPEPRPGFPQGLPDAGWIVLTFANGFQATIHVSWLNPDRQRRLGVVGDRGTLVFDEMADSVLTRYGGESHRQGADWLPTQVQAIPLSFAPAEPLRQMCQHFLDCVIQQRPSAISSGWLGRDLVAIQEAIAQSLTTNQEITLP
ncbi:oxidoreductase, partial [filamentous cyanobacterium CCP5]